MTPRLVTSLGLVFLSLGTVLLASTFLGYVVGQASSASLPTSSPGQLPSATPTSRPTPSPTSEVVTRRTVDVPATLDAMGGRDVTKALQAFLDATPDGSTIRFPPDGRYRIDGTLLLEARRDLRIDGRGATLFASVRGDDPERPIWRLLSSTAIALQDLTLRGAHPEPGTYVKGFEWQHGVAVEGGGGIELQGLDIQDVMGDCVYITSDRVAWADGVWVRDTRCHDSGRQGVAVVAGRDVRVERSSFGGIPLSVLDLEPDPAGVVAQGVDRVVFSDNIVDGPVGARLLNATGVGPVSHVLVERTTVTGSANGIASLAAPHTGSPRYTDIVFRDNTADLAFVEREHAVLVFGDIDGLVISGNRQRIDAADSAIQLVRTCNVILQDNELAPVSRIDEDRGTCPAG